MTLIAFRFSRAEKRSADLQDTSRIEPPLVSDGTIYRALDKLLVLDGEHISYRSLDVEQIGSVYEAMMGFRLETASGRSVAIQSCEEVRRTSHNRPRGTCSSTPAAKRRKWIQDHSDRKITDRVHKDVKDAATLEDLHAALESVLDKNATPDLVPKGAMVLAAERRAAAIGLALHAAHAHRADCAHDT